MLAGDGVAVQGPWSEQFSTNDAPRFDFGEHGVTERVGAVGCGNFAKWAIFRDTFKTIVIDRNEVRLVSSSTRLWSVGPLCREFPLGMGPSQPSVR